MKSLIFLFCLFSSISYAGQATGKVRSIELNTTIFAVLFQLDSTIQGTPRCNEKGQFSIDLRKPSGQQAYSLLLEAKREQYTVTVEGLNSCANEWKSEDTGRIIIQ